MLPVANLNHTLSPDVFACWQRPIDVTWDGVHVVVIKGVANPAFKHFLFTFSSRSRLLPLRAIA